MTPWLHGLVASGIGAILVASACVAAETPPIGVESARHTGRLGGEIRIENGLSGSPCLWLVESNGRRTYLFLTNEENVKLEPLRFVDATGSIVARQGDVITVTGPTENEGFTSCAPGAPVFLVDAISGPGGTLTFDQDPTIEQSSE